MRMRRKPWARGELNSCGFFVENPKQLSGIWRDKFTEPHPLHLDLGCGKCVFLAEIAHKTRGINYVGIDISLDILGVGRRNISQIYGEEEPENVLLCSYNIERLDEIFSPDDKIERIYLNFCNPWPAARGHKHRLTHTKQLLMYKKLLSQDGEVWFKTDNDDLYLATKRYFGEAGYSVFYDTRDLLAENDPENFPTEHEIMFSGQGIPIKALRARV